MCMTHPKNRSIRSGRRYPSIGVSIEDNSVAHPVKSFSANTSVVPLSCSEKLIISAVIRTDKRITLCCFLMRTEGWSGCCAAAGLVRRYVRVKCMKRSNATRPQAPASRKMGVKPHRVFRKLVLSGASNPPNSAMKV
ncbi:hypothetical protein SDC9_177079 [bioreactor metagenome]|uniref:Uncharacterized protein n=1 Tax=bioreactor metagenome TaxID=1076179 RepID=A0A645GTR8_9ZZZZ